MATHTSLNLTTRHVPAREVCSHHLLMWLFIKQKTGVGTTNRLYVYTLSTALASCLVWPGHKDQINRTAVS